MEIETLDHRTIQEPEARAIAELLISIWPKPGRSVDSRTAEILNQWKNYSGPENQHPRSFFVRENGRLIAHAQADPRTIHTTAGDLTVLALCRVCTIPSVRGNKLGHAVVQAAFKLVDDGAYPFALFQTTPLVKPFYEKFGAVTIDNRVVNLKAADPTANAFWDPVLMRYQGGPGWPTGDIDTNGPGW